MVHALRRSILLKERANELLSWSYLCILEGLPRFAVRSLVSSGQTAEDCTKLDSRTINANVFKCDTDEGHVIIRISRLS